MSTWKSRLCGGLLVLLATSVHLVASAGSAPAGNSAAECCQVCEQKEIAGNAGCYANSHDSCDGLQDCYNDVAANVFQFCYAHCINCSDPPEGWDCLECSISEPVGAVGHQFVNCFPTSC